MVCHFVYDGTNWLWVGHVDVNNDISVKQTLLTENVNKPLLLGYPGINNTTENVNSNVYRINNIYANPFSGTLTATNFSGKINNHTINADVPENAVFTDTTYTGTNGINVNADTHVITNSGVRSISAGVDAGTLTVNTGGAQQTIVIRGFQEDEYGNNIATTYLPKTLGVTDVSWDSENNKITRTINGVIGDVVSINTIKTALNLTKDDVGLSNVENTKLSTWAGSGRITTIGTLTGGSIPWSLLTDVPPLSTNNHIHGNIQKNGTLQTTDVVIANEDKLVITDASDSNKIARASLAFDGTTTTQALTKKGTWETFLTEHQSLDAYAPLNSPALIGTPTAPTAASDTNNNQIATTAFVYNAFAANDAMIFKGTVSKASDLPANHKQGWTYKVAVEGTYAGQYCEIGDTIYCIADGQSTDNADWTIIQTNIDGAVIGPANSTAEHIAVFTGNTGKAIKDSGFTIGTSVPANAVFTDTTYTFSNKAATLAWNTTTTVATVGGTDITVKLPENPNVDTWIANTKTTDGYVTAPGEAANKVWRTDAQGNPGWYDAPNIIPKVSTTADGYVTKLPGNTTTFFRGDGSYSNTLTDNLTIKTLTITSADASTHINMSRTGGHNAPNYINIPTNSALAFSVGGASSSNIAAMIESTGITPYATNSKDLGQSNLVWANVYATNFVGKATSAGTADSATTATTANKVLHKLTFGNGAFEFDGSEDVDVPVYDGSAVWA